MDYIWCSGTTPTNCERRTIALRQEEDIPLSVHSVLAEMTGICRQAERGRGKSTAENRSMPRNTDAEDNGAECQVTDRSYTNLFAADS